MEGGGGMGESGGEVEGGIFSGSHDPRSRFSHLTDEGQRVLGSEPAEDGERNSRSACSTATNSRQCSNGSPKVLVTIAPICRGVV